MYEYPSIICVVICAEFHTYLRRDKTMSIEPKNNSKWRGKWIIFLTIVLAINTLIFTSCANNEKTSNSKNSEQVKGYSFIEYDESSPTGAVFLTTIEDVLERINDTSIFKKNIYISDMIVTELEDGNLDYLYLESPSDALQLTVDKDTGHIIYGGLTADMNYHDMNNKDDMNNLFAKTAMIMSYITGDNPDSLSPEYYLDWIVDVIKDPIEKNEQTWSISFDNGLVLHITDTVDDLILFRTYAMTESFYNNNFFGETTSKGESSEQSQGSEHAQNSTPIELNTFNEIDKIVANTEEPLKYTVVFGNETFTMTAQANKNSWVNIYDTLLTDENIVVRDSVEDTDEGILYSISIFALDDYYFNEYKPTHIYELKVSFLCETDNSYVYNIEKNSDLNEFLNRLINEVKSLRPLSDELKATPISDFDSFEWLFYCLKAKEDYSDKHRVIINNEIFSLSIHGSAEDTYYTINPNYYDVIYSNDKVKVVCDSSNTNGSIQQMRLAIYRTDDSTEIFENEYSATYSLQLELECKSNQEFDSSLNDCPDYMLFIRKIADILAN